MRSVPDLIRAQHDAILQLWSEQAGRAASAKGLSAPALHNVLPRYLLSLADLTEEARPHRRKLLETHLATRIRQGFLLPEITEEILLLGTCIADACRSLSKEDRPDASEMRSVLAELHDAVATVGDLYTRHLLDDAQAEKAFLRRIQEIADDARGTEEDGTAPLLERLGEVLGVVTEAVAADSGAVLLVDERQGRAAFTVGASSGALSVPRGPLPADLAPLVELIARHADTTFRVNEISAASTSAGWRAVVGPFMAAHLPSEGPPVALLCVSRAGEPFSVRETRRLEAIAALLTVLLENAHLFTALRRRVAELEAERGIREQFVSVLAHDIRSPLAAAKMTAASVLRRRGPTAEGRVVTALSRVVTGLDRADRMIVDLLDANRIRAGHMLQLPLAPCDLAEIVHDAFTELTALHGDRFRLEGERSVAGIWNAEALKRVALNLGTNAAKYGEPGTPVIFSLARTVAGARMSVHNAGAPIRPDKLATLFEPFARARGPGQVRQHGWGLGLTLVKGAAEALGGSVSVESAQGPGTTFHVDLPLDARPQQRPSRDKPSG